MSPSEVVRSFRPHDGELIWEGPAAGPAEVERAVARARAAQPEWERTPLEERHAVARRFAERAEAEGPRLARLIAEETGKPLWEAEAEVASVVAKVGISIEWQARRAGTIDRPLPQHGPDARQLVHHRPHGVLAVLGPYNFPAHLPNGHVVPALIAGNAVVLKPSELTPAVGEAYGRLWTSAGLPDGVLEVVQGGATTGRALAATDVDGLLFTGSAATGLELARLFAETPWKILALEMGGNNPIVTWDVAEADLEAAAAVVVQSAFLSAGQRCTCARRWILEEGRGEKLVDAVLALVDRLRIGGPFDVPEPFMGPLIDARAAARVERQVAALAARPLRPLARAKPGFPFLSPAVLDATGLSLPDEEIFGPVLLLQRVRDFAQALERASATRFGLAAALVGGDEALWDRFRTHVRAGVVNRNRPTNGALSSAPFGGVGWSGNHRPSAAYAADYCAWPSAGIAAARPHAPFLKGLG
ncbi:MAG: succinylglutamate-semialdehyde dehydrogenase [Sphingomonadaceae bacterium]|uniref:succinylglutamate-semialdehyde dehydrogenase n=1 Tax=Thermaurantiacus sp. TaxID=2820283 RepID=UPI00298ED84E|nr:succinylglutamate-semialdehyde dehydrogenase [Thermaurantiacus sp.]MCS6987317.1 succinylglutamate-semialdehyde dehydrogenase [Sphingomonadaceae bacterium]MDW8414538.1 succinylglutamate-semialdehyde dehydrogenase [Thermaurantiacus sp.]